MHKLLEVRNLGVWAVMGPDPLTLFELIAANNINLTTSNNYQNSISLQTNFEIDVRAEISFNFKDQWESIKALKDVDVGAVFSAVYSSDGVIANLASGNSIDESLQGNEEGINDFFAMQNAGRGGGGGAGVFVHLELDSSRQTFSSQNVAQNNVLSQNDITLKAGNSWSAQESQNAHNSNEETPNINIASTNMQAENDIELNANRGEVNIGANSNEARQKQTSFSAFVNIPILAAGGGGGLSYSRQEQSSNSYDNTQISAQNNFTLKSQHDTNISTTNITTTNINMNIRGDLNLASSQNTSKSNTTSFAISGSRGGNSGANSAAMNFSNSQSDRAWVDNQTSIIGTNSLNINVGNNADIKGAMIANITNYNEAKDSSLRGETEAIQLIDGQNLTLNTKTLTYSHIYDNDSARSIGIGASASQRSATNSTPAQNQANASLNYSMHNKEQTTKATIGGGELNVGAVVEFDEDGEVNNINLNDSSNIENAINRDVNNAQEITKDVSVNPINVSYINSEERGALSEIASTIADGALITYNSNSNSEVRNQNVELSNNNLTYINEPQNDNQNNRLSLNGNYSNDNLLNGNINTQLSLSDNKDLSWHNPLTIFATSILNPISNKPSVLNPFHSIQRITTGITSDIANIVGDIKGIDPKEVRFELSPRNSQYFNVSLRSESDREVVDSALINDKDITIKSDEIGKYISIDGDDKKYYINQVEITQAQLAQNPTLASRMNSFFVNGIMNNKDEATRNAIQQLGGFGSLNQLTLMYDPSAKDNLGPLGIISDLLEVNINYLGNGVFVTGNSAKNSDFINQYSQARNEIGISDNVLFAGHSAGGASLYNNMISGSFNNIQNQSGNSAVTIILNGAPVNNQQSAYISNQKEVNYDMNNVNSGDFVGNGLGNNNGIGQFIWSNLRSPALFDYRAIEAIFGSSPHSNYGWVNRLCNFNR